MPIKGSFEFDSARGDYVGCLTVAVLAGVNWLLDTEGLPWVLEEPTEGDLKFLYAGIKFANDERRQRAAVVFFLFFLLCF